MLKSATSIGNCSSSSHTGSTGNIDESVECYDINDGGDNG